MKNNTDRSSESRRKEGDVSGKRPSGRWWSSVKRWFSNVFYPLKAPLKKFGRSAKAGLGKYISFAFLVMLILSFSMWFIIKLGYVYTTQVPVNVNVEGHMFKVDCMAEGKGTVIFAKRFYKNKELNLSWSDLEVTASPTHPGSVVVSPYSLQNAISARNSDLKILSVGAIPEIDLR